MSTATTEELSEVQVFLDDIDTTENQKSNSVYTLILLVSYIIVTIWMMYLWISHRRKVYRDVAGDKKTREALFAARVQKNRPLPELTFIYQRINLFTVYALAAMVFSSLFGIFQFFSQTAYACTMFIRIIITFIELGKMFMFLVFLMRVQRLYGPSPFVYPSSCFLFFYFGTIIYSISLIVAAWWIVEGEIYYYGIGEEESSAFPNLCTSAVTDQLPQFGAAVIAEDIGVTVGFLWAYKVPLIQTWKVYKDRSPTIARKIAYTGYKMSVLSMTAVFSTIILIGGAAITQLWILSVPDVLFSAYALMFMTAYYPDHKYYRKYCRLCLCCHSHAPDDQLEQALSDESSYRSADTGSAARIAGGKIQIDIKAFDIIETLEAEKGNDVDVHVIAEDIEIVAPDDNGDNNGGDNKGDDGNQIEMIEADANNGGDGGATVDDAP